jgi:UDP:flavonoid glycosyltransferase YjiC (YdhE family)
MGEEEARSLPGKPLVVEYAPQFDLLARASLTITHGGMNTILDSLTHGVPLVAIPITFEQPGNGARVRYLGVGEVLGARETDALNLRAIVRRVLTGERYREGARRVRDSIARAGGVGRAADKLDRLITKNVHGIGIQIYASLIVYLILKLVEIPREFGSKLIDKLRYLQACMCQEISFVHWMDKVMEC